MINLPPLYIQWTFVGGSNWSRTSNVYPEGSDLQSEDAHAIASILPNSLVPRDRIELPIDDYKSTVIPFN